MSDKPLPTPVRPARTSRAAICVLLSFFALAPLACRQDRAGGVKKVETMTAEELVAAHRRAVGELFQPGTKLDTVTIPYVESSGGIVLARTLTCDRQGRARIVYETRPPALRGLPEGASYDGRTLWRISSQGKVRGPLVAGLSSELPQDLAWTILEMGPTPLYCPLADKLGFAVRKDPVPLEDPQAYSLLIGPAGNPYMRVIVDRKTHLIRRVQRMLHMKSYQTIDHLDQHHVPGMELSLPRKVVILPVGGADEPTAAWELAWTQMMRLSPQADTFYADGLLPDWEQRRAQQGRFALAEQVPLPPNPLSVQTADFDRDGLLDLVVSAAGVVAVFHHDGPTPYGTWQPALAGRGRYVCVTPADLDADGWADLLVSSLTSPSDRIYMVRNAGHRHFEEPRGGTVPHEPEWVVAGLFDDDSFMDVAAVSGGDSQLVVYHGEREFLKTRSVFESKLGGRGRRLGFGDFNGDGRTDFAATNESKLVVYTRTSEPGVKLDFSRTPFEAGELPFALVVADLNGDRLDDVAVGNGGDLGGAAEPAVVVLLGDRSGSLVRATTLREVPGVVSLVAADFDGDGDVDLAAASFDHHGVCVWSNHGDATFDAPEVYQTDYGARGLAVGDLDGDGDRDLAVVNQYGNSLTLLLNRLRPASPPEAAPEVPTTQPATGGGGQSR